MTMTKHKLSQEMEATSTTTESDSGRKPMPPGEVVLNMFLNRSGHVTELCSLELTKNVLGNRQRESVLTYSKTCVKRPLPKRLKIGIQDQLSLNACQKYYRMLQGAFCNTFDLH